MRHPQELQIIVAVDEKGGFAKGGKIPWNYKVDWEHFKKVTNKSICIMGRKTYDDIIARKPKSWKGKKALNGRDVYVITNDANFKGKGIVGFATSVRIIMDKIPSDDDRNIFLLGGEKLYIQHIVTATRIHMTIVPGIYNCDRKFPVDYVHKNFLIAGGEKKDDLMFVTYHRKPGR